VIGQAIPVDRRERAPDHAAERGEDHRQNTERRGDRKALEDDVVDAAVLLRERDAEVAPQRVADKDAVLLD